MRRDAARYASMDLPEDNPAFRRGWSWNFQDRQPGPVKSPDRLRLSEEAVLDRLSAELALRAAA